MEMEEGGLSFFSSSHSSHDQAWNFPGTSVSVICIACLVETLEETDVLNVRKRKALGEIVAILSRSDNLLEKLRSNIKISSHLSQVLLGLFNSENQGVIDLAIEGIAQLVCRLKSAEMAREVIEKLEIHILGAANLRKSYPCFVLLGKLISNISPLIDEINSSKKDLLKFFISNVAFPDESIQCALLYIFDLLSQGSAANLDSDLAGKFFNTSCEILASAKRQEVQTNALSVIKSLCCSDKLQLIPDNLKAEERGNITLAKALKKVLLSPDNALQLGSIQCITEILCKDNEHQIHCHAFLESGVVEFLLEALDSHSDLVLGSVFSCLSKFTNCAAFFDSSHAIYGVEPLVAALAKAVKFQNPDVFRSGLQLMAQIFVKQPKNVPLFTNEGLFCAYTVVLQEALSSMDHRVLRQAVNTLDVTLLHNHLPRHATSDMIRSLLAPVTLQLKRFHRPISAFRNTKSVAAQELLASLLSVVRSALKLLKHIKQSTPSLDSILSGQDPEQMHISLERHFAQVVDEVCVPAVMVNYELITSPVVFEHFFAILNDQFSDNAATTTAFSKKLAEAAFIKISMEVKHRCCSGTLNTRLSGIISQFQQRLLLGLSVEERSPASRYNDVLECIPQVPSTPQDCLLMLTQCSVDPHTGEVTDPTLFEIQCACLELLFFSFSSGDKLAPDFAVLSTLHKYLMQHQELDLPESISRHLVFLYAVTSETVRRVFQSEPRPGEFEESQDVVCRHLGRLSAEKVELYYCHDKEFLEWIFSIEAVAQICGVSMLSQWISNEYKIDSPENLESHQRTIRLLCSNTRCFSTFLSLATDNRETVSEVVVKVLDCMFTEDKPDDYRNYNIPQSFACIVADNLHKIFLKSKTHPLPNNSCATLLKIAAIVETRFDRFDLRIVHHTVNLATQTDSNCNVFVSAINYLNVAVWRCLSSTSDEKKRAVSVLFTNKPLIQKLNKTLTNLFVSEVTRFKNSLSSDGLGIYGVTLLIVANLIMAAMKTNSDMCEPFRIDIRAAISFLNKQQDTLLHIAAMLFWSSTFSSRFNPNHVAIIGHPNRKLNEAELQVVFVYLQNSLINENELVRASAVKCLGSLLDYTHDPAQLVSSPWNKVLLETRLLTLGAESALTPSFVHLVTLFVRFAGSEDQAISGITNAAVETVASRIPLSQPAVTNQALVWVCVDFISTVSNHKQFEFTSSQKESLTTWLKDLEDSFKEQRFHSEHIKYGLMNKVLLNEELFNVVVPKEVGLLTKLVSSLSYNRE